MDDELYQALLKADRSESRGPLADGLARELNDELAKIAAAVTLARDPGATGEPLAAAETAVIAARDIGRRIFALGGNDAHGLRTAVAARTILEEAVRTAGAGSAAETSIAVAEDTREVWGDRATLVQAFQNVVRNAAEAMSPTPPRPRIQLSAANATLADGQIAGLPAGEYVEFEIRDNGGGIPAENLDRIWEPFFTTRLHAPGLGLATTLEIVRRHGGQIGVDSSVGGGSVFTFFLPQSRPPEYAGGAPAAGRRFRTGRILLVDDDPEMRTLAAGLLENLAYKCDLARDGEEAAAQYQRYWEVGRPHDAVILDARIPGGPSAEATLARLKEFDAEARVILCGPGPAEELRQRSAGHGFAGWLAKPYRLSELGEVLQTVINCG